MGAGGFGAAVVHDASGVPVCARLVRVGVPSLSSTKYGANDAFGSLRSELVRYGVAERPRRSRFSDRATLWFKIYREDGSAELPLEWKLPLPTESWCLKLWQLAGNKVLTRIHTFGYEVSNNPVV